MNNLRSNIRNYCYGLTREEHLNFLGQTISTLADEIRTRGTESLRPKVDMIAECFGDWYHYDAPVSPTNSTPTNTNQKTNL